MRRLLIPLLTGLLAISACANGPSATTPGGPIAVGTEEDFQARADQVAAAWHGSPAQKAWRTGFIPIGDFTIVTGFATGEAKEAFTEGLFTSNVALAEAESRGAVRFPDGSDMSVAVVSARSAYQTLDRGDPACATCGLTVTAARLGTARIMTSRGEATVPAWIFTVAEDPAPITRVAVAPSEVTQLPEVTLPSMPPGVVQPFGDQTVHGTTIDFTVGVGSCDYDIRGLVKEYDDAIVIGGTATTPDTMCDAALRARPVSVTLSRPIGDRVVLGISGSPIVV
jgi:hypothetical protein